jgi:putative FmdB family regulatory protein
VPLYEYRCKKCGHQFEKIQSFSASDEKQCPVCQGELERMISAPAIQFKGSGWYVNDYAGKGASKNDAKSSGSSESSADSKPASPESKTAASDGGKAPTSASSTTKSD